ncbi:MAG: Asp23/Gls24 family envelope stress response protein [Synergistaceae bacterium]|nr:Asp23/Gls24 family envelope stress response protein [Synergistaceae bacterium]
MPSAAVNQTYVGIKVYAFVGAAGTGKSQRAQFVADFLDADYIIDDGLVIRRTTIVAGRSAKAERNQIKAIRRAMFEYDDHRKAVMDFFRSVPHCSIMIIATSEGMVERIIRKLELPAPSRVIHIEEVATPEEIARARKERHSKGQHVIPVSHVLVRKNFAGKMVGRLRVLWRTKAPYEGEKTIVRPPFSFYGEVRIEPEAIEQLASYAASRVLQVRGKPVARVYSTSEDELCIDLDIKATPGDRSIIAVSEMVRQRVARSIRYFSGLGVHNVNVNVVGVDFSK